MFFYLYFYSFRVGKFWNTNSHSMIFKCVWRVYFKSDFCTQRVGRLLFNRIRAYVASFFSNLKNKHINLKSWRRERDERAGGSPHHTKRLCLSLCYYCTCIQRAMSKQRAGGARTGRTLPVVELIESFWKERARTPTLISIPMVAGGDPRAHKCTCSSAPPPPSTRSAPPLCCNWMDAAAPDANLAWNKLFAIRECVCDVYQPAGPDSELHSGFIATQTLIFSLFGLARRPGAETTKARVSARLFT